MSTGHIGHALCLSQQENLKVCTKGPSRLRLGDVNTPPRLQALEKQSLPSAQTAVAQ